MLNKIVETIVNIIIFILSPLVYGVGYIKGYLTAKIKIFNEKE